MAVFADPEKLQVDASRLLDPPFITCHLFAEIGRHAVEQMGIGLHDVDLVEQASVHVAAIGVFVPCRYADIFVEVEGAAAREIHAQGREPLVDRLHRASCRESQHQVGLRLHPGGYQPSRKHRGGVRIGLNNDFHASSSRISSEQRVQAIARRNELAFVEHVVEVAVFPAAQPI